MCFTAGAMHLTPVFLAISSARDWLQNIPCTFRDRHASGEVVHILCGQHGQVSVDVLKC